MRLGTKILILTLAVILGLSGGVVWVLGRTITSHERRRASATIGRTVSSYFERVDALHERGARIVQLLMGNPIYRGQLDRLDQSEGSDRELVAAQFEEEIFGELTREVGHGSAPPAFYVLTNALGEVYVAKTAEGAVLEAALRSSQNWPVELLESGEPVRHYLWLNEALYLSLLIPLKLEIGGLPSHALFVGYRIDNGWLRRLLGLVDEDALLDAWFMVGGRVVARASSHADGQSSAAAQVEGVLSAAREISVADQRAPIAYTADGERFVGEAVRFAPAEDVRGVLVVATSLDESLAPLRTLQRNIWLMTGGVVLLAVAASRVLSKLIARPIEHLVEGTQRVARGEFGVSIPGQRRDELGELARSFNAMAAGLEQRDLIKDTFGKFVDRRLVEDFLADPSRLRLGGQRRVQSILMSDLANFTPLSEKLAPEDLFQLLNGYFDDAAQIVSDLRGIVDKYIADAVVAFWGPPLAENHAELACRAALRLVEQTQRHGEMCRKHGFEELRVRIGIATGEVLIGNIGSTSKYNYTVFGDVANLSARLEGVNKLYQTSILATARTARDAGTSVLCRKLDTVRVVGRTEPVELHEVMAAAEQQEQWEKKSQLREAYEEALRLYELREWSPAREAFESVLAQWPDDEPSRIMAGRCSILMNGGLGAEWDGVWAVASK